MYSLGVMQSVTVDHSLVTCRLMAPPSFLFTVEKLFALLVLLSVCGRVLLLDGHDMCFFAIDPTLQ
jgi:hypothetical protein